MEGKAATTSGRRQRAARGRGPRVGTRLPFLYPRRDVRVRRRAPPRRPRSPVLQLLASSLVSPQATRTGPESDDSRRWMYPDSPSVGWNSGDSGSNFSDWDAGCPNIYDPLGSPEPVACIKGWAKGPYSDEDDAGDGDVDGGASGGEATGGTATGGASGGETTGPEATGRSPCTCSGKRRRRCHEGRAATSRSNDHSGRGGRGTTGSKAPEDDDDSGDGRRTAGRRRVAGWGTAATSDTASTVHARGGCRRRHRGEPGAGPAAMNGGAAGGLAARGPRGGPTPAGQGEAPVGAAGVGSGAALPRPMGPRGIRVLKEQA
ncbi:uncharacterized protein [Drosophila takahashii]|uniref:uncharacterized protein n=1 Tax=Drosophila takahashii TaxID=29030 RepID=UPI001CF8BC19|nr:collagen alpha-2(I) chain-like [Drosophila takahashii]